MARYSYLPSKQTDKGSKLKMDEQLTIEKVAFEGRGVARRRDGKVVFVEGALFSIGDAHAVQGLGEVSGTAIEAPMRIIYQVGVIKGKNYMKEPQYETDDYYAVTGFGTTIDEASKKAVAYMVDYLASEHNLDRRDAYMLCSLAGDLHIAEVVDVPHMLVTMHMSKEVLGIKN